MICSAKGTLKAKRVSHAVYRRVRQGKTKPYGNVPDQVSAVWTVHGQKGGLAIVALAPKRGRRASGRVLSTSSEFPSRPS